MDFLIGGAMVVLIAHLLLYIIVSDLYFLYMKMSLMITEYESKKLLVSDQTVQETVSTYVVLPVHYMHYIDSGVTLRLLATSVKRCKPL